MTIESPTKTAEPIELPFRKWTQLGRNLASMRDPFTCSGDAAILSNYFDHLFSSVMSVCRQNNGCRLLDEKLLDN